MSKESFSVQTPVFEGPLELLLDLIEKRKLLINDISLAAVTDDYMAYVSDLERHQLPETAQFVLVAATLLLIKSRSLLPVLSLTDEEESRIEDLETRLRLYQIYARAGNSLRTRFGEHVLYPRPYVPSSEPLFLPDSFSTIPQLREGMAAVLARLPKKQTPDREVSVRKTVSLEDIMKRLETRVTEQFRVSFKNFSGETAERPEIIVSFLAVLELIKQGIVMARQESRFADFEIEVERVDTPKYS